MMQGLIYLRHLRFGKWYKLEMFFAMIQHETV